MSRFSTAALGVVRTAVFSDDRQYRFRLGLDLDMFGVGRCVFIMLNPSTADEMQDDPTIRRCRGFAHRFGCQGLDVVNLFAYRATDPKSLYRLSRDEAIGVSNDQHILRVCDNARIVVCAWGNLGLLYGRGDEVLAALREQGITVMALKIGKRGQPGHPLYLRSDSTLVAI